MAESKQSLDQLLTDLLAKYEGVFLGENHHNPSLLESVTRLLPKLKEAGVRTISYELPQVIINDFITRKSVQEIQTRHARILAPESAEALYELVQAAGKNQMRVLGHDNGESGRFQVVKTRRELTAAEREKEKKFITLPGMNKRDAEAFAHINTYRLGKTVVIGGAGHSKSLGKHNAEYPGLNVRLGFPSVDNFEPGFIYIDETGLTKPGKNGDADYIVGMPPMPEHLSAVLRQHGIEAWPKPAKEVAPGTYEGWNPGHEPPLPAGDLTPPETPFIPNSQCVPTRSRRGLFGGLRRGRF